MTKRILFLGSHLQSFRCLKFLLQRRDEYHISGFVPHQSTQPVRADQCAETLARDHEIPVHALDALGDVDFDLGISLMFDRVLPSDVVLKPNAGFVNLHLGPLPGFRGSNSVFHALRLARAEDIWTFSVTMHYMVPKLDSGPIVDDISLPIFEDDTASTLHARACDQIYPLFTRNIAEIVRRDTPVPSRPQEGTARMFRKGGIEHAVDLYASPDEIYDSIRALSFRGKGRPYTMIGPYKIFLTLDEID